MAKGGKFEYGEFVKLYKGVRDLRREFDAWIRAFLYKEALKSLRLVRPMTPVDTGNLRRNWSISKVERMGDSLWVYLINPVEYASFMEEGFTYHTANGDRRYPGFHMAEIAISKVRAQMPARFEREFRKWLARKGWV